MRPRSLVLLAASFAVLWVFYATFYYNPSDFSASLRASEVLQRPQSAGKAPPAVHVVFSTDCSLFQDWQSLGVAYSNWIRGIQKFGRITRLTACADPLWKPPRVPTVLSSVYQVVITPTFDPNPKTGDRYPPRNRPQSLSWLFQNQSDYIRDDEIVVLVDPDEFMVQDWKDLYPYLLKSIRPGVAMAAEFLQGSRYLTWASKYCDGCAERIDRMTADEKDQLQIGAPYVLMGKDLKNVAVRFGRILEEMRKNPAAVEESGWIIDMNAYSVATVEADIIHQRLPFMVSAPLVDIEPWDKIKSRNSIELPLFTAHFCQRLDFKGFSWGKHSFRGSDYSDCDNPFEFPVPSEEAMKWVEGLTFRQPLSKEERAAWMYLQVVGVLQESLKLYRAEFCSIAS